MTFRGTKLQSRTKCVDTRVKCIHFSRYRQSYTWYNLQTIPKLFFTHPPSPGSMLVLQWGGPLKNFDRNWAFNKHWMGGGGMCQQFCPRLQLSRTPASAAHLWRGGSGVVLDFAAWFARFLLDRADLSWSNKLLGVLIPVECFQSLHEDKAESKSEAKMAGNPCAREHDRPSDRACHRKEKSQCGKSCTCRRIPPQHCVQYRDVANWDWKSFLSKCRACVAKWEGQVLRVMLQPGPTLLKFDCMQYWAQYDLYGLVLLLGFRPSVRLGRVLTLSFPRVIEFQISPAASPEM